MFATKRVRFGGKGSSGREACSLAYTNRTAPPSEHRVGMHANPPTDAMCAVTKTADGATFIVWIVLLFWPLCAEGVCVLRFGQKRAVPRLRKRRGRCPDDPDALQMVSESRHPQKRHWRMMMKKKNMRMDVA